MATRVTRRSTRTSTRNTNSVSFDASIVISDSDNESISEDEFQPVSKKQKRTNKKAKSIHKKPTIASNIDEIENYIENPIFQNLSNDDMTPSDLAHSWFDDFISTNMNTKFDALKDFLNFILRSSGCIAQLSRHDVINTDNAKETVDEIQTLFARQKYHEFPMLYTKVGKNNDWKDYPNNALAFVSSIVIIASESGVLYEDDDQFLQLLLEWISAMSTSNIRALRYTSTLFGLTIQSVLCKLSVNLTTYIDKFSRQLKRENETLQNLLNSNGNKRNLQRQVEAVSERIKVIENNVETYKTQKQIVDNLIGDFFNTLFVHRYRDVASDIRLKCVIALGEWMEEYPEMFFESSYLRYLGWLLTDQDSNIRAEVFKVLVKLYKKRITVTALRQFTSYFKQKLIEIIIYETDFNARYNCLQLVNEIVKKGYLEDDDHIKLTSLIFVDSEDIVYPSTGSKSNAPKFFKEIVKMIEQVESAQVNELIEAEETEYEKVNEILPLDSKKILKVKYLLNVLQDSYEYYLNNYSTNAIKKKSKNSKISKFEQVFQYIYSHKPYNENNDLFELLITYLNFDFTAFTIPQEIRDTLELDSNLQYLLLAFINGATVIYCEGSNNQFYKILFPPIRGTTAKFHENSHYISKLVTHLPEICNYFHTDIEKIKILLQITFHILKYEHENKKMKDVVLLFLRYFTVINFPTFTKASRETCTYTDSINHQYITLFETINAEDLDIVVNIDSVLTELKIMLSTEVKSDNVSIDTLQKLFILSHNATVSKNTLDTLTSGLYTFADKFQLHPPSPVIHSEISTFLQIASTYVNKSLHRIYTAGNSNPETINTINTIQRCIALSIDDNTFPLDVAHEIAISYLDNVLSIHAFITEFSHVVGQDDDAVRTLTSHINGSIVDKIMHLWFVREYQVAEIHGTSDTLDRDADEAVSFSAYSVADRNDADLGEYEKYLCELTARIVLACKAGVIDDSELLLARVARNSASLGDSYTRVLHHVEVIVGDAPVETVNTEKKQRKITELIKTRKLIEESESDDESGNDDGGEDPDDPIENSDDEILQDAQQREEDLEFSDLEEEIDGGEEVENDDNDDDDALVSRSSRTSTQISSLASSFPFTQEA
ncbi:hypothetical protein CANINC_004554 [Pichia inconspicua]|uniref:SCD domain-containing protein n=1 Tax=Pichia inconspicua TaxID=52247 RepID=A0A4T0WVL0_9ASCO|nr:hypothetical protein CANINC_004554 [[Candida] inconspicua]